MGGMIRALKFKAMDFSENIDFHQHRRKFFNIRHRLYKRKVARNSVFMSFYCDAS
jgi:hypothetical protein